MTAAVAVLYLVVYVTPSIVCERSCPVVRLIEPSVHSSFGDAYQVLNDAKDGCTTEHCLVVVLTPLAVLISTT